MATITFSNGQSADFEGTPTPADIDYVAKQMGIQPDTPQSSPGTFSPWLPASQANETDNPITSGLVAGGKATANLIPSLGNLGFGLLNAAVHPINTAKGIGGAAIGGIENLVGANKGAPDSNQQTASALGKAFMDRYGSLDNLRKTATNDPAGFGADVLSIVEGGATGLDRMLGTTGEDIAARTAAESARTFPQTGRNIMPQVGPGLVRGGLNSTLSAVAGPVASTVKGTAKLPIMVGGGLLGGATGVGPGSIFADMRASAAGGDANQALLDGLRGNTTPEQLVNQAHDALGQVISNRGIEYKKMVSSLANDKTTYDISPIMREADNQLTKFNITKNADGTLNFIDSHFALDPTAQADIQKLYDYTKGYGSRAGNRTALGIDNLKQVLGGYWSPNSDYRAFTEALRSSARNVLNNAPGYTAEMKRYSDMTDMIGDVRKSLSLGNGAGAETTFTKLTSALKDKEFRKQVLQELDQATGGQLIPGIAGQRLSSWTPRGLAPYFESGVGLSALFHGDIGIVPLLGLALTTSPRLVGEFVHYLGLGVRGTNAVMDMLNKFSTPAVLGGNALNRFTPQLNGSQGNP